MTDETMDDTPQLSATESSEDESEEELVETLIAGRERRKTAGNRYDRDMILEEVANVDEQDEVTLLFADNEEEEDEEFKSGDEDEDADMSSSDDDDQGPNAAADDLEGEKEIQKQAKEERAKKRKADLALTSVAGMRKKLKTDPTRPAAASIAPKPSKKKERVTWVHDPDSGRSSLRKQTIAHRAETIARLKESEAQSKKLKALKEQREKEKARDVPKELTQADRLAEAARVERQNAKSLNRWETMEKKRQEELAAKLAALKDRKLEGPVVTWLSAKAKWIGPKLNKIGTRDAPDPGEGKTTETKKRGRKSKAYLEQLAAERSGGLGRAGALQTGSVTTAQAQEPTSNQPDEPNKDTIIIIPAAPSPKGAPPEITLTVPQDHEDTFLKGIHEYADMQTDSNPTESRRVSPIPQESTARQDTAKQLETQQSSRALTEDTPDQVVQVPTPDMTDNVVIKPEVSIEQIPISESNVPQEQTQIQGPVTTEEQTRPAENDEQKEKLQPFQGIEQKQHTPPASAIDKPEQTEIAQESTQTEQTPLDGTTAPVTAPEPPLVEEESTRNMVILERFEELSSQSRQEYSLFYNNRKTAKPVKHIQELCSVTMLPVRYRDRETGIGFANAGAYKKLQELKEHKFVWSSMLGCYVGREGEPAARGVPEGWS
ncbi:putative signal transducer [Fonsecaea pedrosoi]|nr:putative signal transducer [Fonsecaea pedrosoi]